MVRRLLVTVLLLLVPVPLAQAAEVFSYPSQDGFEGLVTPDPVGTPGAARTVSVKALCRTPSMTDLHLSSAQKKAVYARYGLSWPQPKGLFEIDALIPLSLGGTRDITNLWPEPSTGLGGYHFKDLQEAGLRAAVCAHRVTLGKARHLVRDPVLAHAFLHPVPFTCCVGSRVGIDFLGLTDPVRIGSAQTTAVGGSIGGEHQACTLRITRPDGEPLRSSGLGPRSAAFGPSSSGGVRPTWTWTVDPDSPAGVARMTVVCTDAGRTLFTLERKVTFAR